MCGAQFGGEETSWIGFTEPIFCGGDFVRRGKLVGIWVLPFVLPVGRGMPALFYSSFFAYLLCHLFPALEILYRIMRKIGMLVLSMTKMVQHRFPMLGLGKFLLGAQVGFLYQWDLDMS